MDKLLETAFGVIVAVVALLPGAVGDFFFRRINGINWREPWFRTALRWLGFSLGGLTIYVILTPILDLVPPFYLLPSTYASATLTANALPRLFVPFLGHLLFAGVAALLASGVVRAVAQRWPEAPFGAWNAFVMSHVPERWVVVGLEDRTTYVAKLRYADTSVEGAERDMILEQPLRLKDGKYEPTYFRHLFLPAKTLYSIATIYEPDERARASAFASTAELPVGEGSDQARPAGADPLPRSLAGEKGLGTDTADQPAASTPGAAPNAPRTR